MKVGLVQILMLSSVGLLSVGATRAETYTQTETIPYNEALDSRTGIYTNTRTQSQTNSRTATHSDRESYTQTETAPYNESLDSRTGVHTETRTTPSQYTNSSTAGFDDGKLWLTGAAAEALVNGADHGNKAGEYRCDYATGAPRCEIYKITSATAKVIYPTLPAGKGSVRQVGPLKCGKDNCRFPGSNGSGRSGGSASGESGATAK